MVTLDLKILFDKIEALMKGGTLKRAIVASFPALLPGAKSVLFKLFKGKDLAQPMKSPVAAGIIAGVVISLWAANFVGGLLYRLPPRDPATLIAAASVLFAVGAIAGWIPARRAARIDPGAVLRQI